ncbi:MAG: hypothetical protein M3Q27_10690 [Actinomycetota bacterium]|nr:hypothetical protein [Actinomycetota bacterium]
MRLFRRRTGRAGGMLPRRTAGPGEAHLTEFARSHPGVEAFVEPPTTVTPPTVVFVAASGEWTRRQVPDARAAHDLANRLGVPSYDAAVVGYPQRMRDWNARRAAEAKAARRADGRG